MTQDTESSLNEINIVSNVAFASWKKVNKHLIMGTSIDEDDPELSADNSNLSTFLKNALLLQEFKAAQSTIKTSNILATKLTDDSSVEDYVSAVNRLATQVAFNGYYSLQDACLVMAQILHELNPDELSVVKTKILAILKDWPILGRDAKYDNSMDTGKNLEYVELNSHSTGNEFAMDEETIKNNEIPPVMALSPDTGLVMKKTACADYIASISQFADQVAVDGYFNLQNVSLLLIEALYELKPSDFATLNTDLLLMLDNWPDLISRYRLSPGDATPDLMKILRHPDLKLPLYEDEFLMFEKLLAEEVGVKDGLETLALNTLVEPSPGEESEKIKLQTCIARIEQLAELAAQDGYFGLNDVSLIVAEALHELSANELADKPELLSMLDQWPTLSSAYRQESPTAILDLLKILKSPELNLSLNDEELSTLKTLLTEDINKKEHSTDTIETISPSDSHYISDSIVATIDKTEEEALSQKHLLESNLAIIEQLANQAADDGYFGLQDISLILIEALHNLLQQDHHHNFSDDFLTVLDQWSQLIEAYRQESPTAISELLKIFNYPELNLSLANEDCVTLKTLLTEDIKNKKITTDNINAASLSEPDAPFATVNKTGVNEPLPKQVLEEVLAITEQLANQAANDGYFGLQDVSLILAEALHELLQQEKHQNVSSEFLSMLDNWSSLISIYRQDPLAATPNIIKILKSPDLNLQLSDDDYAMLEIMLEEGANLEEAVTNKSEVVLEPASLQIEHKLAVLPDNTEEVDENKPEAFTESIVSNSVDESAVDMSNTAIDELDTSEADSGLLPMDIEQPVDLLNEVVDDEKDSSDETVLPLSRMAQELVELLQTEAGLLEYRFGAISFDEPLSLAEHLQQAEEELERLANASRMVGFEGLAEVCTHVCANIGLFSQDINTFTQNKLDLLKDWIVLVKEYLLIFSKPDAGKKILAYLTSSDWPLPLGSEASAAIFTQMQTTTTGLSDVSAEENTREKVATDEDINLKLPDDVNQELLDLLLQELPTYTQQFSQSVQKMQTQANLRDIDVAQRIAHTIKGSANTVGIKGIAVLTHHLEDILMACAKEHVLPGSALLDTLINAADCLETMCEFLLGLGEPPHDTRAILQDVLDWANQIDKNGVKETNNRTSTITRETKPIDTVENTAREQTISVPVAEEKPVDNRNDKIEKADITQTSMVRVPTEQIENLFRLSSESIILNGQIYERQRRMKNQLQAMEAQFVLLQQLGSELEQLIDLKDLSGRSAGNLSKDFDALEMDQYNELHTASRRMVEAAVDAHEISVDIKKDLDHMHEILEYQQRLVIDTQEAIMQTRFVPVGSIALRLQRGLRQTCRLTGKQGELILSGEDLLIDGDTLGALVDPLMHLLRNAVDHGLENGQERLASGKPLIGQIGIEFDREGNTIVVRCRDDGRGLDFAAIREAAEKRGVIRAGEVVSEEELKRFILRPNFSTRTQSSQTSGRGVGMDVVNHQVVVMGGTLALYSEQGHGLTVELRMPLPLSRSHALLANVGSYKVAISSKGLTQILYSGAGDLRILGNEQVLVIGDDIYPVKKLDDLLHVNDRRKEDRHHGAVLLVQDREKITAVLVDSITDSRDVVIKNLGYYMRKIHGFVGATILGDGSVTPVLDIPELLRLPGYAKGSSHAVTTADTEITPVLRLPTVLVVEDSLSQRRALEQILVDAGFHVLTARDGIEAVESLSHIRPDIVLTDLEMPRMNGIELTSHIRAQTSSRNLPVIMVTSRSTEKHRQMSEEAGINYYLTKPVQDDDLLAKMQSLMDKERIEV